MREHLKQFFKVMELDLCILQSSGTSENKNLSSSLFLAKKKKNTLVFMQELLLGAYYYFFFYFFIFWLFKAAPTAYGGSQARVPIRATAAGLHQSHSNSGGEAHLRPTPQLTATVNSKPTELGQGWNPQPHGS